MKTHDFKFMYGTNCLVLGVVARRVEQQQHKLRRNQSSLVFLGSQRKDQRRPARDGNHGDSGGQ